ncbi:hypothetical protein B0T20DRAFT_96568 [Sordaria brevicollis]|uniref:Uncharacterized protein n=1 Tax=Sordaria brevicollis TaxID=83679 RepID=A0AAE0U2U1_SORBR|nr:hypothetical protein B0T20DRAFT_96568 [Sordaria brevicollis]
MCSMQLCSCSWEIIQTAKSYALTGDHAVSGVCSCRGLDCILFVLFVLVTFLAPNAKEQRTGRERADKTAKKSQGGTADGQQEKTNEKSEMPPLTSQMQHSKQRSSGRDKEVTHCLIIRVHYQKVTTTRYFPLFQAAATNHPPRSKSTGIRTDFTIGASNLRDDLWIAWRQSRQWWKTITEKMF